MNRGSICLFCDWISVPPSIVPFTFDGPLMAGEDGGLTCRVSKGDAPLTIRWTFSGKELSSSMGIATYKVGKKTSFLTIDSIMPGHSGLYTCSVENPAGTANYSAELIVNGIYSTWWNACDWVQLIGKNLHLTFNPTYLEASLFTVK